MNEMHRVIKMSALSIGEQIGKYYVGPIVFTYIDWVLQQAIQQNIEKLYFMARDGFLMYRAARKLQEEKTEYQKIKCCYFFSSRQSLYLPYLSTMSISEAIKNLFTRNIQTIEDLTEVLNLTIEEEKTLLDILRNDKNNLKNDLQTGVMKSVEVQAYLMQLFNHACNIFKIYMQQTGLLDEQKKAIVDSGWLGNTQNQLYEVMKKCGYMGELGGFYFGLYKNVYEEKKYLSYHSFYFSPENNLKRKSLFCNNVFEIVCSANHGRTIGYEMRGKLAIPVLDKYSYVSEKTEIQKGALDEIKIVSMRQLERILKLFMYTPIKKYAIYLGNVKFSENESDVQTDFLAPILTKKTAMEVILPLRMKRYIQKDNKTFYWPMGSIMRSDLHCKRFYLVNCAIWEAIRLVMK